jgi:hypothetical protein
MLDAVAVPLPKDATLCRRVANHDEDPRPPIKRRRQTRQLTLEF